MKEPTLDNLIKWIEEIERNHINFFGVQFYNFDDQGIIRLCVNSSYQYGLYIQTVKNSKSGIWKCSNLELKSILCENYNDFKNDYYQEKLRRLLNE